MNKNIKSIASLVVTLVAVTVANAQTVVFRSQGTPGSSPYDTVGIITDKIEVWNFGINTPNPDIEIGHLYPTLSGKQGFLLLGGYVAVWPTTQNYFAIPFSLWSFNQGNLQLNGSMGAYLPVGHGPRALFSDQISLTAPAGKGIRFGVATAFGAWGGSDPVIKYGPIATFTINKATELTTRFLVDQIGHGYGRVEMKWKL